MEKTLEPNIFSNFHISPVKQLVWYCILRHILIRGKYCFKFINRQGKGDFYRKPNIKRVDDSLEHIKRIQGLSPDAHPAKYALVSDSSWVMIRSKGEFSNTVNLLSTHDKW